MDNVLAHNVDTDADADYDYDKQRQRWQTKPEVTLAAPRCAPRPLPLPIGFCVVRTHRVQHVVHIQIVWASRLHANDGLSGRWERKGPVTITVGSTVMKRLH